MKNSVRMAGIGFLFGSIVSLAIMEVEIVKRRRKIHELDKKASELKFIASVYEVLLSNLTKTEEE